MATLEQQIAAALAEQVYRRGGADQPLTDEQIGTQGVVFGVDPSGLTPVDGYYYNDATGFVGRVVEANGKIFVVFRGTDGGFADLDMTGTNFALGSGTIQQTQLQDALALYEAARQYAETNGKDLVITGHSLGGGLAALPPTPATFGRPRPTAPASCS